MDTPRDIAAVRSADVFVAVHGAGLTNHIFMRNDTAFLEVVPRGFASMWVGFFFPAIAEYAEYRVRYFGLNIEDQSLSRAALWEREKLGHQIVWERDRSAPT
jgi:capsular polysaccharide biosynthesis protein